jgi:hypothetical protein
VALLADTIGSHTLLAASDGGKYLIEYLIEYLIK